MRRFCAVLALSLGFWQVAQRVLSVSAPHPRQGRLATVAGAAGLGADDALAEGAGHQVAVRVMDPVRWSVRVIPAWVVVSAMPALVSVRAMRPGTPVTAVVTVAS